MKVRDGLDLQRIHEADLGGMSRLCDQFADELSEKSLVYDPISGQLRVYKEKPPIYAHGGSGPAETELGALDQPGRKKRSLKQGDTPLQRIVIVGASFAGRLCAQYILKELKKNEREHIEILMIDKSSHFEFICTNYKSLCDHNSFEYLTVNNEDAMDSLNRGLKTKGSEEQERCMLVTF